MNYYTSTTKYNCGIDLHANQMYVCVMDREGEILVHKNIRGNDFEFFLKLVEPYRDELKLGILRLRIRPFLSLRRFGFNGGSQSFYSIPSPLIPVTIDSMLHCVHVK